MKSFISVIKEGCEAKYPCLAVECLPCAAVPFVGSPSSETIAADHPFVHSAFGLQRKMRDCLQWSSRETGGGKGAVVTSHSPRASARERAGIESVRRGKSRGRLNGTVRKRQRDFQRVALTHAHGLLLHPH